jgi:hypothetical protein
MYDDLFRFFEEEQQINTRISFFFFLSESFRKEAVPKGTSRESGVLVTKISSFMNRQQGLTFISKMLLAVSAKQPKTP